MPERDEAATVQLKVRMKEPLRAQIEQSAAARGVSMNTEIVDRLERTFEGAQYLEAALDLAFGRQTSALIIAISRAMKEAGAHAMARAPEPLSIDPDRWASNPYAYDQAVKAVVSVLDALRPAGAIEQRQWKVEGNAELEAILNQEAGPIVAAGILQAIRSPADQPSDDLQEFGRKMQQRLGAVAERLKDR